MVDFKELALNCERISSAAIHADDHQAEVADIAPPMRLSTTFAYEEDVDPNNMNRPNWYSRVDHPTCRRVEAVMDKIIGQPTLLFASGLSAFHNAMFSINPKVVFTAQPSYHGMHGILDLMKRNYGTQVYDIDADPSLLQKGDVIHLESPVNPAGEARNIQHYADIAHSRGAVLLVDATFAPPPLSDPFKFGADMVLHSATKYFGGHSDLLSGTVSFKDEDLYKKTAGDRLLIGTIIPPMESWLLLRSLRTYALRIQRQCVNANEIVKYLHEHKSELPLLESVHHATLQGEEWVKEQLPYGGPPTFSFLCVSEEAARAVPKKVVMFHHCTSLGGIESMLEWRCISDKTASPKTIRVSVGGENVQDLINDLAKALK